jgi:hypothetical protein
VKTDHDNPQSLEMVEIAAFGNNGDVTVMGDNDNSKFEVK